ncbi:restriction endonuclease subunit S, partial [Gelidibacter sp.]|uniref:restriction endonuclease subunit S n=1 Tax=Gelidibacter sp. TaxID=2018083 RepID=UPI00326397E6
MVTENKMNWSEAGIHSTKENNKVKGMKQTEIGLIPEDWKVVEIHEILKFGSGRDYKHLSSGEIPVYGTGGFMTSVNEFLYDGESVGIGRKGTIDKPVFLKGKFWTVDTLFFTHSFINTFPRFVFYQFNRIPWKEYNEASGVPSLNKNTLEQIRIGLPPLAEQEAIAAALSDCDAWIVSIEQVLAKKRLIKQGVMQELLTPKEDWEVKKLGDILQFGSGRDYKHLKSGEIPVYGTGGVMTYVNEYLYDVESVGIGRKGTIDKPVFLKGKFWTVDTLFFTHSFNGVIPKYIYYQFLLIAWKEYNEASGVPSLNKNTLEQIEIKLPSFSEQTRIATILSDMDLEIEALEQKLNKAR